MPKLNFPFASVVVVGYQSRPHLERCFAALREQDYPGLYELIFVDNASTDGSAGYVREAVPGVSVVESAANLGYAGGNNLGAARARGEVLVFVNPDTEAQPSWLRELVRPIVNDPGIGMTTSKIVLMDRPDVINTCGNDVSLAGVTTCRRVGQPADALSEDEEVAAVSGAACAIRAPLFHAVGGFDPRFWMYLEDTDLSWRVRLAGYRCVVAARSVVAHDYVFKLPPAKTHGIERNRYRMLAKNLERRSLLALLPLLAVGEVITWGWAGLRGPRHLAAKLNASVWALTHLAELRRAHRTTQPLRRVPDSVILHRHRALPPISGVADGIVGRFAAAVLGPLAVATAVLGMAVVDRYAWKVGFEPTPPLEPAAELREVAD